MTAAAVTLPVTCIDMSPRQATSLDVGTRSWYHELGSDQSSPKPFAAIMVHGALLATSNVRGVSTTVSVPFTVSCAWRSTVYFPVDVGVPEMYTEFVM